MTPTERLRALPAPPAEATGPLPALWFVVHGDWAQAHAAVDTAHDAESCLVHAFLHRVEGDAANAAYWYRRASAPVCRLPPDEERNALVARLFG